MPASAQLTSESTVSVLSRYLRPSTPGHGLHRAERGGGKRWLVSRELTPQDSAGHADQSRRACAAVSVGGQGAGTASCCDPTEGEGVHTQGPPLHGRLQQTTCQAS